MHPLHYFSSILEVLRNLAEIQELHKLADLEMIAKQVVEGFITGLHKSPYHGFSVEFAEHRLYNEGESTRFIDWKLYARTEKLFVKRFEEETNLRSFIVMDTSSSMYLPETKEMYGTKLGFSSMCAGALIHLFRKQRDAVGLAFFSQELDLLTDARLSGLHAKTLFSKLQQLQGNVLEHKNSTTYASKALHQLAEKVPQRSLIIIFSDMLQNDMEQEEELFAALKHLKYKKHELIIFHVTHQRYEQQFAFSNRPYLFVNPETGHKVKASPELLREQYVQQTERFFSTLKTKCGQYHIDFIQADCEADFSNVLLPYLIKRNKLF